MKKEFSKILGVGLTVALLASLILVAAPVSAGTLKWTTEVIPSTTNEVLEPGANVTDFDIADDGTIWAGGGFQLLYKSTDDGESWSTVNFEAKSSSNETDLVAVAPDDADFVVVADTTNFVVWLTTDGGTNWGALGNPTGMTVINDIDVSAESAGVHYIAVAGEESGIAEVSTYAHGAAAPAWRDASALGMRAESANSTAVAIAYSPNFASDQVLAVVTYQGDNTAGTTDNISLEMFSENQDLWNAAAGFASYPTLVTSDDFITGVTTGSITLDPEYLGSDDTMRMAFVGLTVVGGDTEAKAQTASGAWIMSLARG